MNVNSILNRLGTHSILVVGDLMLDRYVWGKISRISPEAPIQILNTEREEFRLGGASNVAHNLVALGAKAECLGVVGTDANGKLLVRSIKGAGIGVKGVVSDRTRITPVKSRYIDSSHKQQVLRVDEEKSNLISKETERRLIGNFNKLVKKADIVVASDYMKGVLTESFIKTICKICKKHNKKIIINLKDPKYGKYKGATAVTANLSEAHLTSGVEIKDDKSLKTAAFELLRNLKLEFVVVTRGEKGIYLLAKNGEEIFDKAKSINVYDVTGAGDTVLAALSLGIASGLGYEDAVHLANLAAGIVVAKVGTSTVSRKEIMEHNNKFSQESKIKTMPELLTAIKNIRNSSGKTIVFTNGCFDILHPGHIKSLTHAKQQGDILVVGLNSDKSVRIIKGKTRPIFEESLRTKSLSALECVDYIVVFNEPTPEKLIHAIKPDILVKGADWRGKKVVGESFINSYGGKVVFVPLEKGISTTNIIRKLS